MGFKSSIKGFIIWHFKTQDLTFRPMFVQKYVCHVHNKFRNLHHRFRGQTYVLNLLP